MEGFQPTDLRGDVIILQAFVDRVIFKSSIDQGCSSL